MTAFLIALLRQDPALALALLMALIIFSLVMYIQLMRLKIMLITRTLNTIMREVSHETKESNGGCLETFALSISVLFLFVILLGLITR